MSYRRLGWYSEKINIKEGKDNARNKCLNKGQETLVRVCEHGIGKYLFMRMKASDSVQGAMPIVFLFHFSLQEL